MSKNKLEKTSDELLEIFYKMPLKKRYEIIWSVCDDIEHYNGNSKYHYIAFAVADELNFLVIE